MTDYLIEVFIYIRIFFVGIKEKNQDKILAMLRCHGTLTVSAVMKSLALSEASVRRYFADMERSGMALRYHGGIRMIQDKGFSGYQFHEASSSNTFEKHRIGETAAALISDHDRLFFDSGTTVLECGNALAEKLTSGVINDLRIVTNSLAFATGLTPLCPVVLIGGMIRLSRMDLCGTISLETVKRYNFTKAILGTDAISSDGVLGTTDEDTASLDAVVFEHAQEVLILADSSKLGKSAFVPYGSLFDPKVTLITDHLADAELLSAFRDAGVRVIIADPAPDNLSETNRE